MMPDETLDELERLSAAVDEDLYVTRDSGPADATYLDLPAAARTHLPLLVEELRALRAP